MEKFLRKVLTFSLFPFLYFGSNMVINHVIYSEEPTPLKNSKTLIVGDSHPKTSLNPDLMEDAINVCQGDEPYVISYWKLKKILESTEPENVILGFAPHNISKVNDLKFSHEKWSNEMFERIYSIQEFQEIDNSIEIDYVSYYKTLFKETAFYPKENHFNYIGSYFNDKRSDISDWESAIHRHYFFSNTDPKVSEVAISYLDSIVNYCKQREIEVVLVSHPVHKNYLRNIPNLILDHYSSLVEKYEKGTIVIDKTKEVYIDTLFLNSDHLNEYGAAIFTKEINDALDQISSGEFELK